MQNVQIKLAAFVASLRCLIARVTQLRGFDAFLHWKLWFLSTANCDTEPHSLAPAHASVLEAQKTLYEANAKKAAVP